MERKMFHTCLGNHKKPGMQKCFSDTVCPKLTVTVREKPAYQTYYTLFYKQQQLSGEVGWCHPRSQGYFPAKKENPGTGYTQTPKNLGCLLFCVPMET